MGTCKYCGQSAGFFSRAHKECEEKHYRGVEGMSDLMRRYFGDSVTAADLKAKIERNRLPYFLSEDDIADKAIAALSAYGETLRRPYSKNVLPKIKAFISSVGVPYIRLNQKGDLDKLSQKLFQGYVLTSSQKEFP